MLTATFPLDLGRPRAGWLAEGNAAVERNARAAGALLLDLRGFGARNLVMADHVHPTAFGQVAIAERALARARRRRDGRARPPVGADRAVASRRRPRRLQGDATYAYRHAKVSARAARADRARTRRRRPARDACRATRPTLPAREGVARAALMRASGAALAETAEALNLRRHGR